MLHGASGRVATQCAPGARGWVMPQKRNVASGASDRSRRRHSREAGDFPDGSVSETALRSGKMAMALIEAAGLFLRIVRRGCAVLATIDLHRAAAARLEEGRYRLCRT